MNFAMYLYYRFYGNQQARLTLPLWLRATAFFVLLGGALAVGYSRFVLGMHTLNQIIYGLLIGGWTTVLSIWVIQPIVLETIFQHRLNGFTSESKRALINSSILTGALILAYCLTVSYADQIDSAFNYKKEYQERINACLLAINDKKKYDSNIALHFCYFNAGVLVFALGALCGALYREDTRTFLHVELNMYQWYMGVLLKPIVSMMLLMPSAGLWMLQHSADKNLPVFASSALTYSLPIFLGAFLLISGIGDNLIFKLLGEGSNQRFSALPEEQEPKYYYDPVETSKLNYLYNTASTSRRNPGFDS